MKKTLILINICLLISCLSSKKTHTDFTLDAFSLNGTWHFLASNEISEKEVINSNYNDWDSIEVPGNWDTENKYAHYVGKGYYQRNFTIPLNWNSKQVRIKFDAIYESSKIWLNGKLIGSHKGGYTPFEFNITNLVTAGESNSLVVMADNTFKRGAWWAWGGISRNVTIYKNNDTKFIWQHISAVPDFKTNKVDFTIKYKVENNSNKAQKIKINSKINSENWTIEPIEGLIEANQINEFTTTFKKDISNVNLWHFDDPNLYQLESSLLIDLEVYDNISDNFGIRKLEAIGEQLFLNNEPIRVNGFNRVHDHRIYGNTEPYELIKKDIIDMKRLGGQFSRMMHAPAANSLLKFCDSIGYMIIEEIPVWGRGAPNAIPDNPLTKQWLTEMIERDYNHPSVVGWSVGNEIGDPEPEWAEMTMSKGQKDYVNGMLDHITTLDTTRLKTFVSFTSHLKNSNQTNEPFDKVDIFCMNSYTNDYYKVTTTHKKFPGKPMFISEIGKGQIGETNNSQLDTLLLKAFKDIKSLPYVIGSSLWTYNDYRSNYRKTPPSENRAWGVVDVWRNKKPIAYNQIKNIYSPINNLKYEIKNNTIQALITPRKSTETPSFILKNYKIKCTFFDSLGKEIKNELLDLPIIKPDEKMVTLSIENNTNASCFVISLVSPANIEMSSVSNCTEGFFKPKDQNLAEEIIYLKKQKNNVIVGYNVTEKDSIFTFNYGNEEKNLSKQLTTKLKGAIKIPWKSHEKFFIKIKSNNTTWSKLYTIK